MEYKPLNQSISLRPYSLDSNPNHMQSSQTVDFFRRPLISRGQVSGASTLNSYDTTRAALAAKMQAATVYRVLDFALVRDTPPIQTRVYYDASQNREMVCLIEFAHLSCVHKRVLVRRSNVINEHSARKIMLSRLCDRLNAYFFDMGS